MRVTPPVSELRKISQNVKRQHFAEEVYRVISVYFTWVLLHISITADQATLIQMIFGILGSLLIMTAVPVIVIIGLILWHLGYVFDLVDGEIARYRKVSTIRGGLFLDGINHLMVQPLIYFSVGMYVAQQTGGNFFYLFVAVPAAIFSTLPVTAAMKGAVITAIERGKDINKYADLSSFSSTNNKTGGNLKKGNLETFLINKVQLCIRYPWNMIIFTFLIFLHLFLGKSILPLIFLALSFYSLIYLLANFFFAILWYRSNEAVRLYHSLKNHIKEGKNV